MYSRKHRYARLAFLGLGLLLTGCGPSGVHYPETGATLEGTVAFGKEQVGAALVIAQNDKGSATAFVNDDGRYKLENVPLGEVNIGVDTVAGKGMAMGKLQAAAQGKAVQAPKLIDVPSQYADPSKSGIKTTIKKGENSFNIVIPQ
jgi:hypothetical protein